MTQVPPAPLPLADLAHVVRHAETALRSLNARRILLTGGTGFFGMWLVESFLYARNALALGAELTVLTRNVQRALEKSPQLRRAEGLTFLEGDVRSARLRARHDLVIHAATTAATAVPDEETASTIIDGTTNVLREISAWGAERFLYVSSGAVYGPQPRDLERVAEDFIPSHDAAMTVYGRAKRAAEALAIDAQRSGLSVSVARPFTFVGPHLPLTGPFAIGNFLSSVIDGRAIDVTGDGSPVRSYLYAADLVAWLWTVLVSGAPGVAYNVGSDEPVNIATLAHMLGDRYGLSVSIRGAAEPTVKPLRYVPDISRTRALGLSVQITLDDAVERAVRWSRSRRGQRVIDRS